MKLLTRLTLCAAILAPPVLSGQTGGAVVAANKRDEALQLAQSLTNPTIPQVEEGVELTNPFVAEVRRTAEQPVASNDEPPPPPPPPVRLSDEEALAIVAQSFQPSGALI